MKKTFLCQILFITIIVALVNSFNTYAQDFTDNFEAYNVGEPLACQNEEWTTWSSAPCGPEDPLISDTYAYMSTKSCVIVPVNDLVRVHRGITTGKWYMAFMAYIPEGRGGYFNTLADFAGSSSIWAMQTYFNDNGTGSLDGGGASAATFTYPQGEWFQVWLSIDLGTDEAQLWVNGGLIHTWQYSLGTFGGGCPLVIDANNFYGPTQTSSDEMYFDDYIFDNDSIPVQQLNNDVGTVSIDLATQIAPEPILPQATVQNFGVVTQSFSVVMTINPGGYISSKPVSNLGSNLTQQVTFDNWNPGSGTGPYAVNVCTILSGDENPTNDCKNKEVYIIDESGTWTSGTNYCDSTYLGSGVGNNGYLYSFGGNTPSNLNTESCKYEVATNTWTPLTSLPDYSVVFATATVGNYIYIMGGSNGTTYKTTVYKYDIAGDSYTTVAPLPAAIGWGKAVGYGNYIYFAGGVEETSQLLVSTVYVYDTVGDTWTAATSMPGEKFGGAFSVTGNQLVYAAGASDAGISDIVYVGTIVNPTTINWVTAENKYPGINKQLRSMYDANFVELMISQTKFKNKSPEATGLPAGSMYRFDGAPWGIDGIIVAGGSPTAAWEPADPNPCYVYNPTSDTWTAQENVPIPVLGSSLGTVNDGATWKLILASGLGGPGPTDATQIYTNTLGATTFPLEVTVMGSWNMLSIPGLHPTNQGVTTWWPNLTGSVFKFGTGYVEVITVVPTEGYWVNNSLAETYSYPAIEIVTHDPISVVAGWSMIGGYENIAPVSGLIPSVGTILSVFEFTASGYLPATNLVPGYGYWINMSDAGTVTIPDPPLSKVSGEVVEYIKEDWGKIIITDNAGRSYTLYAVNGGVDLNKYELPPVPPTGMFDIRYGSDRIAEDISSTIQSIEMSGLEYPITVKVENMDIRLQDETGNEINENIKSGEEMTISNSLISKLMVTGELIPDIYALEQNYPNPFNPSTVIEFSLPEDVSNVKLTIYDVLGQQITQLVNTSLKAGKYSYQWDAGKVATGMYIYELRTDKFVSVKKMMFLK